MTERMTGVGSEVDPKSFTSPVLASLRAYWDKKRGARTMPSRADIRPSEIKDLLGWVVMLDVIDGGKDFRYRLIGTYVTEYFLGDRTGGTVSEVFSQWGDAVKKGVLAVFRKTARDCVPMRAFGNAGWMAVGFEEFESLYLPLSDDGKTCNVIIHAFVFDKAKVMLAREIARANGGHLIPQPPKRR